MVKQSLWKHAPPWEGLLGDYKKRSCRCFFFDSGAHSLYNMHVRGKDKKNANTYKYYETKEFYEYVDKYAAFIKENKDGIDHYVNVDAIYNPDLSWKILKYLEDEHGLNPVPVIHRGTDLRWLDKHLEAGYKYIGIGGLGQESTRFTYTQWADRVFDRIADPRTRKPTVKIHGFAMTSVDLLLRYPWYSVDSASWTKAAGYGVVLIPRYDGTQFLPATNPHLVIFNNDPSNRLNAKGKHYFNLSKGERLIVDDWIVNHAKLPIGKLKNDTIGGKILKHGLLTHFGPRAVANLKYFEAMANALPKWPWPFHIHPPSNGFFT